MMPSLVELAEETTVHLLPRPTFETVERDGYVYVAGVRAASVHRVRLGDIEAAVAWTRGESARREHRDVTWWIGGSAKPGDLVERLLALGLKVDEDEPSLTGMVATMPPPAVARVEVQRVATLDDYLAALEIDWEVWKMGRRERQERRILEHDRWPAMRDSDVVHHYAAFLDGRRVGFARAIYAEGAVALFGGAVLPDARGNGVYRALVRARWDDAVARGTPTLVVQAGAMSKPVLAGLGFETLAHVRLLVDGL